MRIAQREQKEAQVKTKNKKFARTKAKSYPLMQISPREVNGSLQRITRIEKPTPKRYR